MWRISSKKHSGPKPTTAAAIWERKGLRYLEWTYDSDPDDHVTETEYVYVMRDEEGNVFREFDRTESGLFSMDEWERLLAEAGFKAYFERVEYTSIEGDYFAIAAIQE
nr:hypothetical protein [Planococcus glaciei]